MDTQIEYSSLNKKFPSFSVLRDYEAFEHRQYKDGTVSSFEIDLYNKTFKSLDGRKERKEIFKFRSLRYVMPDNSVIHITYHRIYLTDDITHSEIIEAEKKYVELREPCQECLFSDPMCILVEGF